jgi:DUF4097 and DUF4098 domain-containing protein YvlB
VVQRSDQLISSAEGAISLEISSVNGEINVLGSEMSTVEVDYEIVVNGRDAEKCRDLADRTRITLEREGNRLVVKSETAFKMGYNFTINFNVRMPKRLGIEAETVNGELVVHNSNGTIHLESTNGSIIADSISGAIEVSTTNGGIILENITATELVLETVNGGIECGCIGAAPKNVEISTVNGAIEVALPEGVGGSLSIETLNGGMSVRSSDGKLTSKSRGSLEMSVGTGTGKYEFSSVNGGIDVVIGQPPE